MKVSVCIASYNGEKYIKEQIASILVQISNLDEIIISDDGSTDATLSIIKQFNDFRIKLVSNNGRVKGVASNFENALLHSTGDIIFLADQDDIWNQGKVQTCIDIFNMNKDALLLISDAEVVNADGHRVSKSYFLQNKSRHGFLSNFLRCRYLGCCYAFRKELLRCIIPFPKNKRLLAHDYWILICAYFRGAVFIINEPLIKYRRHGANVSAGGGASTFSLFYRIHYRIYTVINATKNCLCFKHG